ncbi:hypothetical protein [Burkholderia anthina]|nr:hypothetical protein [Burkholderia anthina]
MKNRFEPALRAPRADALAALLLSLAAAPAFAQSAPTSRCCCRRTGRRHQ